MKEREEEVHNSLYDVKTSIIIIIKNNFHVGVGSLTRQ